MKPLKLSDALYVTVPNYTGRLYEIGQQAPISTPVLVKIQDIIEIMNRGIEIVFKNDDFVQPVYSIVKSYNDSLDLMISEGIDPEDEGYAKAHVAEKVLAKKLNIWAEEKQYDSNVFARGRKLREEHEKRTEAREQSQPRKKRRKSNTVEEEIEFSKKVNAKSTFNRGELSFGQRIQQINRQEDEERRLAALRLKSQAESAAESGFIQFGNDNAHFYMNEGLVLDDDPPYDE